MCLDGDEEIRSEVPELTRTSYSPFDPDLKIAGEKIKFIVNVALDPKSL